MLAVPMVTAIISDSGVTPAVGQPYTLSCSIRGVERLDSSVTYQWIKYDDLDMEMQLMANSENYSFSSLNLSDSGNYSCMVVVRSNYLDNDITAESDLVSIILQGK